jgi:hypothetical protein
MFQYETRHDGFTINNKQITTGIVGKKMIPPSSASSFLESRLTWAIVDADRNGGDNETNDSTVDYLNAVISTTKRSIRKEERNPSRSDQNKSRDIVSCNSGKNTSRRRTVPLSPSPLDHEELDVGRTPSRKHSKKCNSNTNSHLVVLQTHGEDYEVPLNGISSANRSKTKGCKQASASGKVSNYCQRPQGKSITERQQQKKMVDSSCNYFDLVIPKQNDLLTPISGISLDDPDWLEELYDETVSGIVDSKVREHQQIVEVSTSVEERRLPSTQGKTFTRPPVRHRSLPHPRQDAVSLNCPPFRDDGLHRRVGHHDDGKIQATSPTSTTQYASRRVAVNLKKPIPEKVTAYLHSSAWEEHQRILTDWRHFVHETRPMLSRRKKRLSNDSCSPSRTSDGLGDRALTKSVSFSPVQQQLEATLAEHDDLMSLLDPREVEQRKKILQRTLGRAKKSK